MLCLGVGVNPIYFDSTTTLDGQLFGSPSISNKIGDLQMIKSIDTTFDLLSSDAFIICGIRYTVLDDCRFTHFIPLYINEKHGQLAMKEMDKFVLKLWTKESKHGECHPWLKLYTIGNMMKSLIASVMKTCQDNYGLISMKYSVNVLETYFRLHHTLIAIYLRHKEQISPLLEYQIEMFFSKDKKSGRYCHRDKTHIPDLGVFLSYLTLWGNKRINNNKKCRWLDIGYELLDEIFTRQSKSVLNSNNGLMDPKYCSLTERVLFCWKTTVASNRLFLLNYFFFSECFKTNTSLQEQFNAYNSNFGFHSDNNVAFKFKKFVEHIHYNVFNYKHFFDVIGIEYIGRKHLGLWFIECMNQSEYRGYHKRHLYSPIHPQRREIRERKTQYWIKQQQIERRQFGKQRREELKKQKQLGQRRLQQFEEARMRLVHRKLTNESNDLPFTGSFSFSRVTGGRVVADNVDPSRIKKKNSCDYLRVYLEINKLSDDVRSLDEIIIDAFNRTPRLNPSRTNLDEDGKVLFGKLFDTFANNKDGTMSRNDLRNYVIYYDIGIKYLSVDNTVSKIFDGWSKDSTKSKLTKTEWFGFWARPRPRGFPMNIINFDDFDCKQIVHYPDRLHDDGVAIAIKKVNQGIYYSDFCLSEIFWRFGRMNFLRIRVRGKYIDGSPFECVVHNREYMEHVRTLIPSPAKQQTQKRQKRQKRCKRAQKQQQGEPRYNSRLKTLGNKTGQTSKIGEFEKGFKHWLKTEKNRIKNNLSNGNFSPYGNGIRKTITSRIYHDRICRNNSSIKFCISTIKNGVTRENVNEILLDCQIVRVSVILTTRESYDIGVAQIYFDGESIPIPIPVPTTSETQVSMGKCYDWTKKKKTNCNKNKSEVNGRMVSCQSVVVHGPIYGKYGTDSVVYYSDFSLTSLCNRFGKGLKHGIMPRARGYTIDGNEYEFYFCGGYDYLIYGKCQHDNGKQTAHQVSNSLAPRPCVESQLQPSQQVVQPYEQQQQQQQQYPQHELCEHQHETIAPMHSSNFQMGTTYSQLQAVQPIVSQQEMNNSGNQAQLVPVCMPRRHVQSNGVHAIVPIGYVVPNAMSQMHQVQQVQQFEVAERAPIPRGMHNGAIPRRPPMKNMNNNNNSINLDCDSNCDFDQDRKSSVGSMVMSISDNASIATSDEKSIDMIGVKQKKTS